MPDDDPLGDLNDIVDDDLLGGDADVCDSDDSAANEGPTDPDSDVDPQGLRAVFRRRFRAGKPTFNSLGGSGRLGARIGDAVGGALATLVLNVMLLVSRLIPFSAKFWKGLLKAGYRGFYKSSRKVETVGHIMVGGEIKHVPLEYDHEQGRYQTLSDDPTWWETAGEAADEYTVAGSVPAVWASARSNDLGSHVQAEVAEALDLGRGRDLYTDATVRHVTVDGSAGTQAGEALADGGRGVTSRVTVEDPGQLADMLVSLDHDADARVVSMDKYYETYPATEDPEKMSQERLIGRLMERDEDYEKLAMKMLLIAGAIIVGALGVWRLLPIILGGGGGGGGGGGSSMIPIITGFWGL